MIRRAIEQLRSTLQRFRREDRAVAAVEFALVAPFLIALYFGSIEMAVLFTTDKRINSISATVGDLVSQWDPDDGKIAVTTIKNNYMAAATGIMTPYSTTGLKIVVSLVEVKADGTTKVLWSVANTGATARTTNSVFTPLTTSSGTNMNLAARGGCVVAAEVNYAYTPMIGEVFAKNLNLGHTNYFLPRYGSAEPINTDATSYTTTSCTA
jgi:Flp pilus assembly protein TadG